MRFWLFSKGGALKVTSFGSEKFFEGVRKVNKNGNCVFGSESKVEEKYL